MDQENVDVIAKLSTPISVKEVRSFLGPVRVYKRFTKYSAKIANPLCKLLETDCPFDINESCFQDFIDLKEMLVMAPIIVASNWNFPFEVM